MDSRDVSIPKTKLLDTPSVEDGDDCSVSNLAQAFKSDPSNPYRTGIVGKWHLYSNKGSQSEFDYEEIQSKIRSCGFDFAEAVYPENLGGDWTDVFTHTIDHNM
jgi:arylsulfatase A-like enzyme